MNMVQMNARWYYDVFPLGVCEAQEAWEQIRLCRRLRAVGVYPANLNAARRDRLMIIGEAYRKRALAEKSPIEEFLEQRETYYAR